MKFNFNFKKLYIYFFFLALLNIFFSTDFVRAKTFSINDIEISTPFEINFDKNNIIDEGFILAFDELILSIVQTKDQKKLQKTSPRIIKGMIETFSIKEEKFIDEIYYLNLNVSFNKKKIFALLEKKNIFPSLPVKKDIFFIPIIVNENKDEIFMFSENYIFNNWNSDKKKYHLLNYILPSQDLEDTEFLKKNIEFIEDYKFEEIIKKYDLNNFIILIIQKNENEMNILSKMQFNEVYKIFNVNYPNINFKDDSEIAKLIIYLKTIYEDEWKNLNLINTSINLPITVSLSSEDNDRIILFEETLKDLDFVANYSVLSFNSENIVYKVIFNGSPNKFFSEIKNVGFYFEKNNQIWKVR